MLRKIWFTVIFVVLFIIQTQCADKYTDKNRPYEFGFRIGEEQHRHEKKDENGIIMGEFGFLTADGVYHVTVYATDENGNFKILSMKNIRVKPYPTTAERQGHSIPFPPSQNLPQTQGPSTRKAANVAGPLPPSPARSCSHCSLPTTTTLKPKLTDIAVVSRDEPDSQITSLGRANEQANRVANSPPFEANLLKNRPSNLPVLGLNPQQVNSPVNSPDFDPEDVNVHARSGFGRDNTQYDQFDQGDNGSNQPKVDGIDYPLSLPSPQKTFQSPASSVGAERSPKQLTEYPQEPSSVRRNNVGQTSSNGFQGPQDDNKPVLLSARMQIVDKNTDINYKKPGEKDGLPKGLTKDSMQQLLYTFNYTVGFHGHFEEGYTSGAKQGYYFVTGRNGVRTRVDYVADENGFRPKITQEVLDLLSDDVPKPETEKEPKFGLKGYEFKWLYYPVASKS